MSELTLDEAIRHCLEVAQQNETKALSIEGTIIDRIAKDCRRCAADNRQLAEWLTELLQRRERCAQYEVEQILNLEQYDMLSREYEILNDRYEEAKLLLKAAVEDFSNIYDHIFDCDGMCDTCPIHGNRDTCDKWVHADEALKLIGDSENGT